MSAMNFIKANRGYKRICTIEGCSAAGAYRWQILGRPLGLICGRHRNVMQKAWDGALDKA